MLGRESCSWPGCWARSPRLPSTVPTGDTQTSPPGPRGQTRWPEKPGPCISGVIKLQTLCMCSYAGWPQLRCLCWGMSSFSAGWRVTFSHEEMPEEMNDGCCEGPRWSRVAVSDGAWRARLPVIQPSEGPPTALQTITSFWKSCFRIANLFPDGTAS